MTSAAPQKQKGKSPYKKYGKTPYRYSDLLNAWTDAIKKGNRAEADRLDAKWRAIWVGDKPWHQRAA